MATVEVKDMTGKKVGTADLAETVFSIAPNTFAVHQVVRSQMAARRQGTHSSKGRSDVSGGGAKPWKQKGTGRARQGSIRSGQWKGGGVIFGPSPRSHAFKVPNKIVKLAMRSVLSAKAADGQLYVVDSLGITEPSTKQAAAVLSSLGIDNRVTIVCGVDDVAAMKSFRNIPKARIITAPESNTYDLVDNVSVLFTKPALEWLEGVLK
jgi:large subunit ribosomal protein L4